jgi:hypothetical protein
LGQFEQLSEGMTFSDSLRTECNINMVDVAYKAIFDKSRYSWIDRAAQDQELTRSQEVSKFHDGSWHRFSIRIQVFVHRRTDHDDYDLCV